MESHWKVLKLSYSIKKKDTRKLNNNVHEVQVCLAKELPFEAFC